MTSLGGAGETPRRPFPGLCRTGREPFETGATTMQELLSEFLSAHKSEAFSQTIPALFRQAVRWYPSKTAVQLEEESMTFQELDQASDRLAEYLVERQVQPGEVVACAAGRSVASIAIILGIWKAGAAYVALDPECPEAHNRHCLEAGHVRVSVGIDDFLSAVAAEDPAPQPFPDRSRPDGLALILFTSGSTGTAKGVCLRHANLSASVSNFDVIPFYTTDSFASFSSLLFIASVYDISLCLALGCTLHIVPGHIRRNIRDIAGFYIRNHISVSFLPPHMAAKYIAVDEGSPLRLLLVGSEAPRNLDRRPYTIVNVYASSEACAIISHYDIVDRRQRYPIGKLVPALEGYVVDDQGNPVQLGTVGELWLSGPQLFDCYLDLPGMNARCFAPNPFDSRPGFGRVFKTADMVRQFPDGAFEFVCRRDNMCKVRGFRVELTGTEEVMRAIPGVRDACVTCFTDHGGTNILFGYYQSDRPLDHDAMRKVLGEHLPYYAVPVGLVWTKDFPKTISGKVDRHGFPPPPELDDHKLLAERYH